MSKLESCKCGSNDISYNNMEDKNSPIFHFIECSNCHSTVAAGIDKTKEEAFELWNLKIKEHARLTKAKK